MRAVADPPATRAASAAYHAFTEGRVKLESLDAALVPAAIADFERAMALDPRYARGARRAGERALLAVRNVDARAISRTRRCWREAIDHVRRAIELERDLAEAHATLAFLLMSARRAAEALLAARRAVALEPGYWGNQFRLAHAAWGGERLQALARAIDLYPDFPFVHFEAAMVHIARGELDRAESVLREGTIVQDRQADLKQRYPAKGLHWLLGLVRLARGDADEAHAEFQREIASGTGQLYAPEFAMNAHDGAGFASLRDGDGQAAAVEHFRRALELFPEHARSLVGLGAALAASGDSAGAEAAFARAEGCIESAAARRAGQRGDAGRRVSTMPRAGRTTRRCTRSTSCSIARSCRSPAGRSRSSRCSNACVGCTAIGRLPRSSRNGRGEQEDGPAYLPTTLVTSWSPACTGPLTISVHRSSDRPVTTSSGTNRCSRTATPG